jgi:hypothetical protein
MIKLEQVAHFYMLHGRLPFHAKKTNIKLEDVLAYIRELQVVA